MKCENCGHENAIGELICAECHTMLVGPKAAETSEGLTRHLDQASGIANFPRWGTARLGSEHKLVLHVRGHDQPLVVPLAQEMILGRYDINTGETPEIDLTPYDAENLGVSRRHAAIVFEDEALKVVDLGSANFTYINGQKLIEHQARILRDDDELRLGNMVVRVSFA